MGQEAFKQSRSCGRCAYSPVAILRPQGFFHGRFLGGDEGLEVLSEWDHFSDFFGIVIWRILERGRSVFDRFYLSVPCLAQAVGLQARS